MNKKFIVMAAFAAVFGMSFTACSNEDESVATGNSIPATRAISFSSYTDGAAVTRGLEANANDIATEGYNLKVWALNADATENAEFAFGAAAAGVNFNWSADNLSFMSNPEYLWSEQHDLSFVAMTPQTFTGTDYGYGEMAATAVLDGEGEGAKYSKPQLDVAVTIPTTLADQKDIMFAMANSKNFDDASEITGKKAALALTFKHALAQISFKGKLKYGSSIEKVTVNSIELVNVANDGTLHVVNSSADATTVTTTGVGTANKTVAANIVNADVTTTQKTEAGTTYLDITNGDAGSAAATRTQQIYMLPQTYNEDVDDAGESSLTAPVSGTYLKVNIDMWVNGTADQHKILDDKYVYVKFNEGSWNANTKYIYLLEFTPDLLNPIRFTVSEISGWNSSTTIPTSL